LKLRYKIVRIYNGSHSPRLITEAEDFFQTPTVTKPTPEINSGPKKKFKTPPYN